MTSLRFLYDLSPPELSSFRHWERLRRTPCIPPLNENCKGATLSTIPKILVEGVKQNGSLHVFEGLVCGEWSPVGGTRPKSLFSPDMHRKIQAYLDRNRELPKVLSNLVDTTDESVQNNGDAVASSPHQRMVPDLLAAATMVPRMAPTHFLKGLAAVVA
jgi:hypothetical protein